MRKLAVKTMLIAVAVLSLCSGCAKTGGRRGGTGPGEGISELYPESIPGDMMMLGQPFEETRSRADDVQFPSVLFGYDSFQLPPSELAKIEKVGDYLSANMQLVLVVEGHCDERGSSEYNLSLGEQRAQAVRAYLVSMGISSDRVQTRSYGEEHPIDAGHNEAAWRLNRRAEFVVYR